MLMAIMLIVFLAFATVTHAHLLRTGSSAGQASKFQHGLLDKSYIKQYNELRSAWLRIEKPIEYFDKTQRKEFNPWTESEAKIKKIITTRWEALTEEEKEPFKQKSMEGKIEGDKKIIDLLTSLTTKKKSLLHRGFMYKEEKAWKSIVHHLNKVEKSEAYGKRPYGTLLVFDVKFPAIYGTIGSGITSAKWPYVKDENLKFTQFESVINYLYQLLDEKKTNEEDVEVLQMSLDAFKKVAKEVRWEPHTSSNCVPDSDRRLLTHMDKYSEEILNAVKVTCLYEGATINKNWVIHDDGKGNVLKKYCKNKSWDRQYIFQGFLNDKCDDDLNPLRMPDVHNKCVHACFPIWDLLAVSWEKKNTPHPPIPSLFTPDAISIKNPFEGAKLPKIYDVAFQKKYRI